MGLSELDALIRKEFPTGNKADLLNAGERRIYINGDTVDEIIEKNWEREFIRTLKENLPSNTFRNGHPIVKDLAQDPMIDYYYIYFINQEWEQLNSGENAFEYGDIVSDGDKLIFERRSE